MFDTECKLWDKIFNSKIAYNLCSLKINALRSIVHGIN